MDSKFSKANDSPGFLLWQATNNWQRQIRNALKDVDLTHVQFVLLALSSWLTRQNEGIGITQVQLAQHSKVDVMMASQVLRLLEKKGYIMRKPHPQDTRANLITMTSEGERVISIAIKIVEEVDHQFFFDLGEGQYNFVEMLNQLVK